VNLSQYLWKSSGQNEVSAVVVRIHAKQKNKCTIIVALNVVYFLTSTIMAIFLHIISLLQVTLTLVAQVT
jgi:hypothetical protein